MSTEQQSSWKTYAVVATISAAIGFGAIYVMVGGGSNGSVDATSSNSAAQRSTPSSTTPQTAGSEQGGAPQKLNVGMMTTFVFKDNPTPLPEVTFNDGEGKATNIKAFAGKVVLLNLWATWCAPCRREMPSLDRLQAELGGDNFEVVAVSVDRGSPDKSRKFLEEINVKALKLYHEPTAQLGFTLKTIGMPSTLLLDHKGREIGRLVGPAEWNSDDAKRLVRAHIKPKTN